MEEKLRYRGRVVSDAEVLFIRGLIARHPEASRRALSELLCEAWNWRQPNGVPKAMVCRGLMLALHRGGHIELPAVRRMMRNPFVERRRPAAQTVESQPLCTSLQELRPLEFRQVRRTRDEPLLNALIEQHHYLGYTQPVGEQLKYLVLARGRPVACLMWSSAPRHLGPRDRFIGWSAEARRRNISLLAYNSRFLILPWVHVPHLASHILGHMARVIASDWQRVYGHPVYFLETFTDPTRFRGTCYRAANWVSVGLTTGRGHNAPSKKPRVPVKRILAYPLVEAFRQVLASVS